jgi:hypothetical protein
MFIRELNSLKQSTLDRWVIMVDFNLIYKDEDKNNNRLNRRLITWQSKKFSSLEGSTPGAMVRPPQL